MFQLLLDVDDLAALERRLKFFSVDRFNLVSFHKDDHLAGGGPSLRAQVEALLGQAGVDIAGGQIRLLAMPRVLGRAFNPLSLFFCHRPDGRLGAILYEVNNTFGERHVYVLPVNEAQASAKRVRQSCEKQFFVSPFMPMALRYDFDVRCDDAGVGVSITVADADGELLWAGFQGRSAPLTDLTLMRAWASAPLLSLKVLGAIHWEALRMWCKGLRLHPREPAKAMGVTFGAAVEGAAPPADSRLGSKSPVFHQRAVG